MTNFISHKKLLKVVFHCTFIVLLLSFAWRSGLVYSQVNTVSILIVDKGVSSVRADINSMQTVWMKALYIYDNGTTEVFANNATGQCLYLNGTAMIWNSEKMRWETTVTGNSVGKKTYALTGVNDKLFGVTHVEEALSLKFDGVDDYAEINNLTTIGESSSLALEFWVKLLAPIENQSAYSGLLEANNGMLIYLGSPEGFISWQIRSNDIDNNLYTSPLNWTPREWYLLTFIVNNTKMSVHRNGELIGETTIDGGGNYTNFTHLSLGVNNNNYFNGEIDDLNFYNVTLDNFDIKLHYQNIYVGKYVPVLTVNCRPLVCSAEKVHPTLNGVSYGDARSSFIIWDRVLVFSSGSSNGTVRPGSMVDIYYDLRYEFDGLSITNGMVLINDIPANYQTSKNRWELSISQDSDREIDFLISSISGNTFNISSLNWRASLVKVYWDSDYHPTTPISPSSCMLFIASVLFILYVFGDVLFSVPIFGKHLIRCNLVENVTYKTSIGLSIIILFFSALSLCSPHFEYGAWILFIFFVAVFLFNVTKKIVREGYLQVIRTKFSRNNFIANLPMVSFFIVILVQSFFVSCAVSGFVGSTNDDAATFSFLNRLIFDQGKVPTRYLPYHDFVIGIQTGPSIITAFFCSVLRIPIYQIIILFSTVIPLLITFATYSFTQVLFGNKWFALLSATISAFFTAHTISPVGWGGIPYLLCFVAFYTFAGFLCSLSRNKLNWAFSVLLAFFMSLTIWVHPASFIVALFFSVSYIIYRLLLSPLLQHRNVKQSLKKIVDMSSSKHFGMFLVMFFLINIPFLFNLNELLITPNQGFPLEVVTEIIPEGMTQSSRLLFIENLDFNLMLGVPELANICADFSAFFYFAPFYLLLVFLLFFALTLSSDGYKRKQGYSLILKSVLVYMMFMLMLHYIKYEPFFTSLFPTSVSTLLRVLTIRIYGYLTIPMLLLSVIVIYLTYSAASLLFRSVISCVSSVTIKTIDDTPKIKIHFKHFSRKKVFSLITFTLTMICILSVLSVIVVPQMQLTENYDLARNQQQRFNVLTQDDLDIMSFVEKNIPNDAVFLVSFMDGGQYLTTVTKRKSIYPPIERVLEIKNYSLLLTTLSQNPSNITAVPILQEFNISHIYIGAKKGEWANISNFDSNQFLTSPLFNEVKNVGNAWVFKLNDNYLGQS